MDDQGTLGLEDLVLEKPVAPRNVSRVKKGRPKCPKKEVSLLSHLQKSSRQSDLPNEPSTALRVTAVPFAHTRISSEVLESTVQKPLVSVMTHRGLLSALTCNIDTQRPTCRSTSLHSSSVADGQAHHQPTSERLHLDRADSPTPRITEILTSPYRLLANPRLPQTIARTTRSTSWLRNLRRFISMTLTLLPKFSPHHKNSSLF